MSVDRDFVRYWLRMICFDGIALDEGGFQSYDGCRIRSAFLNHCIEQGTAGVGHTFDGLADAGDIRGDEFHISVVIHCDQGEIPGYLR